MVAPLTLTLSLLSNVLFRNRVLADSVASSPIMICLQALEEEEDDLSAVKQLEEAATSNPDDSSLRFILVIFEFCFIVLLYGFLRGGRERESYIDIFSLRLFAGRVAVGEGEEETGVEAESGRAFHDSSQAQSSERCCV